jgi:hypothetical protein
MARETPIQITATVPVPKLYKNYKVKIQRFIYLPPTRQPVQLGTKSPARVSVLPTNMGL